MRESNQDKRVLLRASIGLPRRLEEEGRKVGEAEGGGGGGVANLLKGLCR